jgi:hypothetical protein
VNGDRGKPHRLIRPGDRIRISLPAGRWRLVEVVGIADRHVERATARELYLDHTPPPTAEEIDSGAAAAGTPPAAAMPALRRTGGGTCAAEGGLGEAGERGLIAPNPSFSFLTDPPAVMVFLAPSPGVNWRGIMGNAANWDTIVLGGTVLTMEEGREPIANGAVAIADGTIAAVGPAEELLDLAPTGELINAASCIIMPGLVNTHSHRAMTLLRGIADDLPLKEWLEGHIWPAEKVHMKRDTVRLGTELAVLEQLRAGVTTTTDMYFFGDEVCAVLAEAGMRGVVAESLIDFPTPRCATTDEMFARQRELLEAFRNHPLITPSVAAHAPYSVSAANLVEEAELAEEYEVPMQIHLAEAAGGRAPLAEKDVAGRYLADCVLPSARSRRTASTSRRRTSSCCSSSRSAWPNPVSNPSSPPACRRCRRWSRAA